MRPACMPTCSDPFGWSESKEIDEIIGVGAWTFVQRHNKKELPVTVATPGQTGTSTTPATSSFDKKKYSLTDPSSIWIVVNKKRPLDPLTYAPSDLTSVGNGQQMADICS